ncbi:MAG: hypothetical protein RL701_5426 [Pseudomonadota bacterium]
MQYGYLAIVAGTLLEGEAVLLMAGALAHRGLLALPWVIAAAFVGGVIGDQLWFRLGLYVGPGLIASRPKLKVHQLRAQRFLDRFGVAFVVGFRFVVGLRSVTPLLIGSTRYPAWRFTLLNSLGCALWASTISGLGWALGAGATRVLALAKTAQLLILVGVVGMAAGWFGLRAWRVRQRRS